MNSDTCLGIIRSDYASTHPLAPAVLNLTAVTDTVVSFANTTGPAIVSIPTQTAILGSSTPLDPNANPAILMGSGKSNGYRGSAPYFTSQSFDGRPFQVLASLKCHLVTAAGGATVWTPKLWNGTNATPANNKIVLTTGTGLSVPLSHVADLNAYIKATLIWDSVSQTLGGMVESITNCWDVTAGAIITAVANVPAAMVTLSAITLTPNLLNFLVSITNLTTAPTSSATTLTELSISAI